MVKNFGQISIKFFKKIIDFFLRTDLGRIIGLLTLLIGLLQTLGIWEDLLKTSVSYLDLLKKFLIYKFFEIPVYFLVLSLILLVWLRSRDKYLKLVSGEFFDDFSKGLSNWEYGGEGWKTEYENGKPLLSVSESPDGGISKKGFSWNDYEFSFKNKIINKNAGWIIRAENRNKYIMIQLWMEKPETAKLRLHYRIPPKPNSQIGWIVVEETQLNIEKPPKLLEWVDVRLVVLGSNIDVYLNNQHCAHYFIPDPIRWESKFITLEGVKGLSEKTYVDSINYPVGRVGFRCSGNGEHAHFRDVRIKPSP